MFPTKYSNEAQPLVILEALGTGAAVIATDRGCICGMIDESSGNVTSLDAFEQAVIDFVKRFKTGLTAPRTKIHAGIISHQGNAIGSLEEIVTRMCRKQ